MTEIHKESHKCDQIYYEALAMSLSSCNFIKSLFQLEKGDFSPSVWFDVNFCVNVPRVTIAMESETVIVYISYSNIKCDRSLKC